MNVKMIGKTKGSVAHARNDPLNVVYNLDFAGCDRRRESQCWSVRRGGSFDDVCDHPPGP